MHNKSNNVRVSDIFAPSTQLTVQYPNHDMRMENQLNALGIINYMNHIDSESEYWHNTFSVCSNNFSGESVEQWQVAETVYSGIYKSIRYQYSNTHLIGYIAFDLNNIQKFKEAVFQNYLDIFTCIEKLKFSRLVRIWNYIPDIHVCDGEMDRYRHFCEARHNAFEKYYHDLNGMLPAATAVGIKGRRFYLYFIATNQPVIYCENPRQVSAFHYPRKYGPKSPSFARATLLRSAHSQLMISGTASVVGYESMHPGDIKLQTQETLDNIQALITNINSQHGTKFNGLQSISHLKIYMRYENDIEAIRNIVGSVVKPDADIIYLEAEICRDDLLVEIEGIASEY